MVLELNALRAEKNYELADALKREITLGWGAKLYIYKTGTEFLDAQSWE